MQWAIILSFKLQSNSWPSRWLTKNLKWQMGMTGNDIMIWGSELTKKDEYDWGDELPVVVVKGALRLPRLHTLEGDASGCLQEQHLENEEEAQEKHNRAHLSYKSVPETQSGTSQNYLKHRTNWLRNIFRKKRNISVKTYERLQLIGKTSTWKCRPSQNEPYLTLALKLHLSQLIVANVKENDRCHMDLKQSFQLLPTPAQPRRNVIFMV